MLFLSTVAISLLLAVSANVGTNAAVKTAAEELAAAKGTTFEDTSNKLQARVTKAHDQMIAKFSAIYESKKNFKAVSATEAMATVPYSSTGFIYQNSFFGDNVDADSTCSSISQVIGYPVNSCIQTSNYAFKLQLTQNSCSGGIVQYFGDEGCTIMLGTSDLEPYMNVCEINPSETDFTFDYPVYASWGCGSSAYPIAPAGSINILFYERNKCSGSLYGYYSFPVNTCMPHIGTPLMYKYYCDGGEIPTQGYWIDDTCSGPADGSSEFPTTCSADASDDDEYYYYTDDGTDDDDYEPPFINPPPTVSQTDYPTPAGPAPFAFQLFCPITAPTLKPAFAPTMFPTAAAATAVSLTLAQTVYGIDSATFNANFVYTTAFATTVASTMTGITSANIINLQISGSRRRLSGRSLAVANEAVTITYTISATTTSSADSLYYQLDSAVTSGAFNTALTQYAAMYGASGLEGCTSSRVGPPSSSSNGLSAGAIAGIVIGCVAGVAIIAALIFFLIFNNKKAPMAQAQPASEMTNKA